MALLLAYLPDAGRGFAKDDFAWIRSSRARSLDELVSVLRSDNGFYRPLVSLSFAANEWQFGLWPFGYALANLAFLLACMAALFALARALGMEAGAAWLAACLWALNPHGIGGLVLWISGRTSALLTLFALLAALAFVKGRPLLAAAACLLALLSKEEAVLLPAVLAVWGGLDREGPLGWNPGRAIRRSWPLFVSLLLYLAIRTGTSAFWPLTAPTHYRFTTEPAALARNVAEYADRAGTFTAAVLLALGIAVRRLPRLGRDERYWLALAAAWTLGGFGLTVLVPVRSSLYACFPLAGVALGGAAVARSLWRAASPTLRPRLAVAGLVLPLALVPLYRSRNVRTRKTAEMSTRVLADLDRTLRDRPDRTVMLEDDPETRPNLRECFGTLLEDALALRGTPVLPVQLEPPGAAWTTARIGPITERPILLRLRDGRLVPVADPDAGSALVTEGGHGQDRHP